MKSTNTNSVTCRRMQRRGVTPLARAPRAGALAMSWRVTCRRVKRLSARKHVRTCSNVALNLAQSDGVCNAVCPYLHQ